MKFVVFIFATFLALNILVEVRAVNLGDLLREKGIRKPEELATMSEEDKRNTLIEEIHHRRNLDIPELQGKSNDELAKLI
uniref:Uncharacterized protein n=1 Tax=Plectus sambesii TaxID=2011161 RepID=A0A914X1G2_9BILA